jgi:hypothetical protein
MIHDDSTPFQTPIRSPRQLARRRVSSDALLFIRKQ